MKRSITLKIDIPQDLGDFNSVEGWAYEKGREISRELFLRWCRDKEAEVLKKRDGISKQRRRGKYVATRFGEVFVERQMVAEKVDGAVKYYYPLDREIGIESRRPVAEGLKKRGIELSVEESYRAARDDLAKESGERQSHGRIWGWVQSEGEVLVKKQHKELERALQVRNTEGIRPKVQQKVVAIETDATGISSREGKGHWMGVKQAIIYTGKRVEWREKRGKRPRYRLEGKVIVAGLENAEEFGNIIWHQAQKDYGVDDAQLVLFQGDGDEWIKGIKEMNFPQAHYQLDLWHLKTKLTETLGFGDSAKLMKLIYRCKVRKAVRELELRYHKASREKKAKYGHLLQYVCDNEDGILKFRQLQKEYPEVAKALFVNGSGAIEKNIEILIGRRFKRRGMHWSEDGANRLLKLRVLKHRKREWQRYWSS